MLAIRSIRCTNFKGLAEVDLQTPLSGCVLIEGPNEAGKTSLLDAVRFAITGLPPAGTTAESLIRNGASRSTVYVELAGDRHSIEIGRAIFRSKPNEVRMVSVDGFDRSTTESETEAAARLDKLLGLSARNLSRACFVGADDSAAPRGRARSLSPAATDPPRRDELRRAAESLGHVSDIDEKLEIAGRRLGLVEAGMRLDSAEGEFSTLKTQLDRVRIRKALIEFRSAEANASSVRQSAVELEGNRADLREELRVSETRAATRTLVAALRGSIEADIAAAEGIDSIQAEIADERAARGQDDAASRRLANLIEARQCLAEASRSESVASGIAQQKTNLEGLSEARDDLVSRRSQILETRSARDVKAVPTIVSAGMSDIDPRSIPDQSMLRRLATELGIPSGPLPYLSGWPAGSVAATAAAGIALLAGVALLVRGDTSNLSTLGPAAAFALLALGLLIYAAILTARQRASDSVAAASAEDGDSLPAAEELLLAGIDDEIANIEDQLSRSDLEILQTSYALATAEADKSRRRAGELLDREGLGASIYEIDIEIARFDERLQKSGGSAARLRRLEAELESVQTRRDEIRSNASQRVERLRELWAEIALSDLPDAQELDALQATADAAGAAPDPVEISRRMTEISARIAALEPILDECTAAYDEALETLTETAAHAGVTLAPDDVEGSLSAALPNLRQASGHDEYRIEAEIASLQTLIDTARSEVQSEESAVGSSWRELDIERSVAEVDRLEREITVRKQAAQIAAKADAEVVRKAAARAEYLGRELLPAFVGDKYFDLRLRTSGGAEVWDEAGGCWLALAGASAGLRQQVELVIRLAGSSAALVPAAAGTPGFLFIDDPASFSDRPRRKRIVEALNRGPISDVFRQMFVFSVSGTMDPHQFGYQVSLENGMVTSSTLPDFKQPPVETAIVGA